MCPSMRRGPPSPTILQAASHLEAEAQWAGDGRARPRSDSENFVAPREGLLVLTIANVNCAVGFTDSQVVPGANGVRTMEGEAGVPFANLETTFVGRNGRKSTERLAT